MRQGVYWTAFLCIGLRLLAGADLPEHPLNLREALELMHARNPLLASARAHTEAIEANEITAGLRPNPVFSSANEDFNVFNFSRFSLAKNQEFAQNVSQLIERGHKRQGRLESARLATVVARDSYRDVARQLEFALKSGFVAMLLAKSNLELARDNLLDYRETVRLNEIRLKAGEISPTELDRVRIEQARFETDLLNAQLALAQARTQLQNLLGFQEIDEKFDIVGKLEAPELPLGLQELEAKALANRPDYRAARDGVAKAGTDVRLADANGATDFAVGSEYKRNGIDNTLGFTLSVPLRIFDRNQGEKVRTRRELEASRAAEISARNTVRADVVQAYEAYRLAKSRAKLYSQDYLQRARQVRDRTEFSYRHGGASLLEFLDAARSYRDVELAWRSAYAQVMNSIHQLGFAVGAEVLP